MSCISLYTADSSLQKQEKSPKITGLDLMDETCSTSTIQDKNGVKITHKRFKPWKKITKRKKRSPPRSRSLESTTDIVEIVKSCAKSAYNNMPRLKNDWNLFGLAPIVTNKPIKERLKKLLLQDINEEKSESLSSFNTKQHRLNNEETMRSGGDSASTYNEGETDSYFQHEMPNITKQKIHSNTQEKPSSIIESLDDFDESDNDEVVSTHPRYSNDASKHDYDGNSCDNVEENTNCSKRPHGEENDPAWHYLPSSFTDSRNEGTSKVCTPSAGVGKKTKRKKNCKTTKTIKARPRCKYCCNCPESEKETKCQSVAKKKCCDEKRQPTHCSQKSFLDQRCSCCCDNDFAKMILNPFEIDSFSDCNSSTLSDRSDKCRHDQHSCSDDNSIEKRFCGERHFYYDPWSELSSKRRRPTKLQKALKNKNNTQALESCQRRAQIQELMRRRKEEEAKPCKLLRETSFHCLW